MAQSKYIHKSHNVLLLLYQIVCPAKYPQDVFSDAVDKTLKDTCLEISKRFQIYFLEIGTDEDHVHFFVQSVPLYSPTKIVTIIKSLTTRERFSKNPEVKKQLWGGEFWTDGYFVNTVSRLGNEDVITKYVREPVVEIQYKVLHKSNQLALF